MTTLYVADSSDPMAEAVEVTIQTGDNITALKKLILAEWGTRGRGLAAGDIRLWKVRHCSISSAPGRNNGQQPDRKIPLFRSAKILEESRLNLGAIATALILTDDIDLLGPRTSPNSDNNVIAEVIPPRRQPISPLPDERAEERDTIGAMHSRTCPYYLTCPR